MDTGGHWIPVVTVAPVRDVVRSVMHWVSNLALDKLKSKIIGGSFPRVELMNLRFTVLNCNLERNVISRGLDVASL